MKYCKKCGAELNDEAVFCKRCGTRCDASSQGMNTETPQSVQKETVTSNSKSSSGLVIGIIIGVIVIAVAAYLVINSSNNAGYSSDTYNEYDSYDMADNEEKYEPETPAATVPETQAQTEPVTVKETEPVVEEYEYYEDDGYDDSSEYMLYGSDEWYISDSDLRGFGPWECKVARNEIYARHGRLFNDNELQRYFDSKSWYYGHIAPDSFDENVFSAVEKANITTIKNYEKSMGW